MQSGENKLRKKHTGTYAQVETTKILIVNAIKLKFDLQMLQKASIRSAFVP